MLALSLLKGGGGESVSLKLERLASWFSNPADCLQVRSTPP